MNPDIFMVFDKQPAAMSLYEAAEAKIIEAFPEIRIKVGKTQIGFYNKYLFAALWPPIFFGKRFGHFQLFVKINMRIFAHSEISKTCKPLQMQWYLLTFKLLSGILLSRTTNDCIKFYNRLPNSTNDCR